MTKFSDIKSYAVIIETKGLGYSVPRFFSSLSVAYRAFIDCLAQYTGDRSEVKCYCIGEFRHDTGYFDLYDDYFEITLNDCKDEDDFDHTLFELVQTYFTNNEKSMYQLALKIPPSGKDE